MERFKERLENLKKTKKLMKKLNKRKIKWIIKEMKKREISVYQIAKQQRISKRHVWRLYHRYLKEGGMPFPKACGRKPREILEEEVSVVKETYKEYHGIGAVNIERILKKKKIEITHNKVHKILISEGLAKEQPAKKKRRKWVRYERKHSNSLWHTDWFEYKKKQCILYEDDASRLITGHGEFRNATTNNSIVIFDTAVEKWGLPKQVMSDHGTQFCANEEKEYKFEEHLKQKGVQLIKARVKHPQSNGKLEKLIDTIKRLLERGLSLDEAVKFYNEKRPHMSLENGDIRTPIQAFYDKMRKN